MFVDKPKNANFVLTNKYTQLSTLYHLCVQKAKLNAHKVYNTLKLLNNTNLESDFYWGGGDHLQGGSVKVYDEARQLCMSERMTHLLQKYVEFAASNLIAFV